MKTAMALVSAISDINDEYVLFGAAALISVAAFGVLILTPALSSFSRGWEKLAAGVLSLFVLAALIMIGLVIGLVIFYNWDTISQEI